MNSKEFLVQEIRYCFLENSELFFTCVDNFMQQLRGPSSIICRNGSWSSMPPVCINLDPLNKDGIFSKQFTFTSVHFNFAYFTTILIIDNLFVI